MSDIPVQVNVAPEDIERAIVAAILQSAVGKSVITAVQGWLEQKPTWPRQSLDAIVNDVVERQVRLVVIAEANRLLEAAGLRERAAALVEKAVTDEAIQQIIARLIERAKLA